MAITKNELIMTKARNSTAGRHDRPCAQRYATANSGDTPDKHSKPPWRYKLNITDIRLQSSPSNTPNTRRNKTHTANGSNKNLPQKAVNYFIFIIYISSIESPPNLIS